MYHCRHKDSLFLPISKVNLINIYAFPSILHISVLELIYVLDELFLLKTRY